MTVASITATAAATASITATTTAAATVLMTATTATTAISAICYDRGDDGDALMFIVVVMVVVVGGVVVGGGCSVSGAVAVDVHGGNGDSDGFMSDQFTGRW